MLSVSAPSTSCPLVEGTSTRQMAEAIRERAPGDWPANWHLWNNTKAAHRLLAKQAASSFEKLTDPGVGRGIVIAGGGNKYFPGIWVLLRVLRQLGCQLPVEIWHLGPQEFDPVMARLLEPYNVSLIDALEVRKEHPCRIMHGWELKPYSILHSRFREVLFLDADNCPTRDPEYLFDSPQYRQAGAVFWPDFCSWTYSPTQWQTFGYEPPEKWQAPVPKERVSETFGQPYPEDHVAPIESGQVLIDKQIHGKALQLALWFCEHSDFYFYHMHGDKDAFFNAWYQMGASYNMPNIWPGYDRHTILQHDFDGNVLFHHRVMDKLRMDGSNVRAPNLPQEDTYFELLGQLCRLWSGRTWLNTTPSAAEKSAADELSGRRCIYRRAGHPPRVLDLLPDGSIGDGARYHEQRWSMFDDRGNAVLAISGHVLTCLLRRDANRPGCWTGRWVEHDESPVDLTLTAHVPDSVPPVICAGPTTGWQCRPDTWDLNIVGGVTRNNEYRLPARFKPHDLILDIGAHIGGFSYAAHARGSRRILAYEPNQDNFRLLLNNVGVLGGVICMPSAVWRSDRHVPQLHYTGSSNPVNTGGGNVLQPSGSPVPAVRFDDVVLSATQYGLHRVRLLKLDCEFSEFPILMTSTTLDLVDEICGEYHECGQIPEAAQVGNVSCFDRKLLRTILETHGFRVETQASSDHLGHFWARR